MTRSGGGLEQVERAGNVDVYKGLRGKAGDIRLVQRPGVDDGLYPIVAKYPVDQRPVGNRSDNIRVWPGHHVNAEDVMAAGAQAWHEEAGQPTRRAGEKYAHRCFELMAALSMRVNCRKEKGVLSA